jgi:hypothetical protein
MKGNFPHKTLHIHTWNTDLKSTSVLKSKKEEKTLCSNFCLIVHLLSCETLDSNFSYYFDSFLSCKMRVVVPVSQYNGEKYLHNAWCIVTIL